MTTTEILDPAIFIFFMYKFIHCFIEVDSAKFSPGQDKYPKCDHCGEIAIVPDKPGVLVPAQSLRFSVGSEVLEILSFLFCRM